MLLKENDVAKANNTVRSEEISSEIWFIALSYPSLSSLLGRADRRGGPKGRVVVRSKWLSLNLPPRRCATPLLFQEGSCFYFSFSFSSIHSQLR